MRFIPHRLVLAGLSAQGVTAAQPTTPRDSAGIRILDVSPARLSALPVWRLEGPTVSIGEAMGDPKYELNRVGSASRLADGRIVVASDQVELRFFDTRGAGISHPPVTVPAAERPMMQAAL